MDIRQSCEMAYSDDVDEEETSSKLCPDLLSLSCF